MSENTERAVAIVGVGAILPGSPDAPSFWKNVRDGHYLIADVPSERWSPDDYYDADPAAPDKTYSKIGGWVRGFNFDWKRHHIPPRVASAMDEAQQWAVTIAAEALADYGWPSRPLDTERCGVVLGTAMGGELHYRTAMRVCFPELAHALEAAGPFEKLPEEVRREILASWRDEFGKRLPPITEDTMPGELANIVAGRVANVLNLRGPNFITDAACASSFAAVDAAVELLVEGHCDAVISGGVDRNMGASSFVKFCKIGALSATGTRPFGAGADGFVMGEGCAAFLLRRLEDAERDGDRIYAVVRGVGASSDGKGKGITAPNPIGQKLATERAWSDAGLDPATATLVEAHGTSTKVGDVTEVESLSVVFGGAAARRHRARLRQEQRRSPESGRGRRGLAEGDVRRPPQAPSPDPERKDSESRNRLRVDAVRAQPRAPRMEEGERHAAARRRLCLRIRRDQLPPRPRGARPGQPHAGPRSESRGAGERGGGACRERPSRRLRPHAAEGASPGRPRARRPVGGRAPRGAREDGRAREGRVAAGGGGSRGERRSSRPNGSWSTSLRPRTSSRSSGRPRAPLPAQAARPSGRSRCRGSSAGADPRRASSPSSSRGREAST